MQRFDIRAHEPIHHASVLLNIGPRRGECAGRRQDFKLLGAGEKTRARSLCRQCRQSTEHADLELAGGQRRGHLRMTAKLNNRRLFLRL